MSSPATTAFDFSAPSGDTTAIGMPDGGRGFDSPANRALAELTLALSAKPHDAAKWGMGQSLRFIFATCGVFWLAAGIAYFTLH